VKYVESTEIIRYIDDYMYLKKMEDDNGIQSLQEEGNQEYVTIKEAGETLLNVIEDILRYVDTNQAVTEVRLKAVVSSLPGDVKFKIKELFQEAEDDLLEDDE